MAVTPAVSSPNQAAPKASKPCPHCGKPLTDAAGLGWCQACGYCRSLEEAKGSLPQKPETAASKRPSMGGLVELGEAVGGLPRWVWIMVVGAIGFASFSLLPAYQLPPDSFDRALWTTSQIGIGLAMMFVAQFVAVIVIAPEDEKISFKDVLVPFRLWSLALKRLPKTHLSVWLASWGLTLIVSALILVGGLPYWMNYLPGGKLNKQSQSQRR